MPENKPTVALPRNWFVALVVGVCVLSAAIGSGMALMAQEGPAGPPGKQGKRGPAGPQGPAGESATGEVEALKSEVDDLRGQVEEGSELQQRIEDVEAKLSGLGGLSDQLCEELESFC